MSASVAVHTSTSVGTNTSPTIAAFLPADRLLTILPCIPRPADTRVVSTRATIQTRGGTTTLGWAQSARFIRASWRNLSVCTNTNVWFDTFASRTTIVGANWSQTEAGEGLHPPAWTAVTAAPATTHIWSSWCWSYTTTSSSSASSSWVSRIGDILIRSLISSLESKVSIPRFTLHKPKQKT